LQHNLEQPSLNSLERFFVLGKIIGLRKAFLMNKKKQLQEILKEEDMVLMQLFSGQPTTFPPIGSNFQNVSQNIFKLL
jgi:hypothetical protein